MKPSECTSDIETQELEDIEDSDQEDSGLPWWLI